MLQKSRLTCGEYDNVTTIDGLRTWDTDAVVLRGLSHNAHVEDPNAVWSVIQKLEKQSIWIIKILFFDFLSAIWI